MPESYNKDAYKKIYQHPEWRRVANEYERSFARNLHRAPVVQDAARGTLVRLSNMLNAYYGMKDKRWEYYAQTGKCDMTAMAEHKAMTELAADISGTTPQLTNTLEDALLADAASGRMFGPDMNRSVLENAFNGENQVDAQMNMIFNAVSRTSGPNPAQAARSRNVQNMLRGLDDSLDEGGQMSNISLLAGDENMAQAFRSLSLRRENRKEKRLKSMSGPEFFEEAALERGKRKAEEKRKEQLRAGISPKEQGDLSGKRKGSEKTPGEEPVTAEGMLRRFGVSRTTLRLLEAYRLLGAGKRDLLFFRLALIAWMVQDGRNSMYEVLQASHSAGLKGTEDISEAATMYTTLDPMTEPELRSYAPNQRFPHETIYVMMLNDVRHERLARNPVSVRQGSMFTGLRPRAMLRSTDAFDADNYEAQDLALNIYTSDAHKVMNTAAREDYEGKARSVLYNDSRSYLDATAWEKTDIILMNKIYDVIQISSRMSQDALALRGAEESDQTQILPIAEHDTGFGTTIAYLPTGASNEGRAAYRGVTYRGGGAWPDLMGNAGSVFQSKSMLSTSQFATVAADFLNMSTAENNVMVRFMLDGKGSVRIADVSQFGNEAEVLVPTGTTFRIEHAAARAFYKQGSVNQLKYEEELTWEDVQEIMQDQRARAEGTTMPNQGRWREVRLVVVRELMGPTQEQNMKQRQNRAKNQEKARQLSEYRTRMSSRQAGAPA